MMTVKTPAELCAPLSDDEVKDAISHVEQIVFVLFAVGVPLDFSARYLERHNITEEDLASEAVHLSDVACKIRREYGVS